MPDEQQPTTEITFVLNNELRTTDRPSLTVEEIFDLAGETPTEEVILVEIIPGKKSTPLSDEIIITEGMNIAIQPKRGPLS